MADVPAAPIDFAAPLRILKKLLASSLKSSGFPKGTESASEHETNKVEKRRAVIAADGMSLILIIPVQR